MSEAREEILATPGKRRWGIDQRLEFIEFRLFWDGAIKRSDLMDRFGVSMQQASQDLAHYDRVATGNIAYDKKLKRFVAGEKFSPQIYQSNPDRYLIQLRAIEEGIVDLGETNIGYQPPVGAMPVPHRRVDGRILRRIVQAIRAKECLSIHYHSMNRKRPDALWRDISPHAFSYDGLRWHVRGYCHLESRFKDFVLSRFLNVGEGKAAEIYPIQDRDWREFFTIILVPNPELFENQQKTVALDYNMTDNKLFLRIRKALLWYFEKRLRLDIQSEDPKESPIIVQNGAAFRDAISHSNGEALSLEDAKHMLL